MKELTAEEQEIVRKGQLAEAALNSPAIASAVNELSEQLSNALLGTQPHEGEFRERCYYLHKALGELAAILKHRVNMKNQIMETVADAEENNSND